MTDAQARIITFLKAQCIAMTAKDIAAHIGEPVARTHDLLRDLEDCGQVCGGESGFYRTPNTLRKRSPS